ncbi:12637_t:CDS:2 [Entrophospora sp. SA101]|nr:12637_t:CDS:2 [Entrophospora sp. SA101]
MTKTKHINSYDWLIEDFQEFYNYKNCQSYYSEKFCSTGPLYSEDGNVLKDNHEFIWRLKLLPRHIDSYISLYIWPIQSEHEQEYKLETRKNLEKLDCYGYLSEKKFIFNSDRPCQGVPEFCKISQIFPDKDYKKKTNLLIRIQFTYPSFNQINANTSEDEESNKQLAIIENPIYLNNTALKYINKNWSSVRDSEQMKSILSCVDVDLTESLFCARFFGKFL